VTQLTGLLLLVAGVGGLTATGSLAACCLRLASPLEYLLATYVLAWSWLVATALLLSPLALVTRAWLASALVVSLLVALAFWHYLGRPRPPTFAPVVTGVRDALRRPAILILAVTVGVGVAYSVALAVLVPANDGDALAYHLARAAFWHQEHQIGYVANAIDLRLNVNPPNGEIGQLATMLLSGSDRYVALPQLAAYAALVVAVAALARRIGLTATEASFGALVFATLPVVLVQASSALNDLVLASFLAAAAVLVFGSDRRHLILLALAIGLAVGTKFTALLVLPVLLLVAVVGTPARRWPGLALAGCAGLALGSVWYVLNLVETGNLEGGLADEADQRVTRTVPAIVTNALRYTLDVLDMSGAPKPHSSLFLVAACVLAVLGFRRFRRNRRDIALLVAFALTASVVLAPMVDDVGQHAVVRAWAALGRPDTAPFFTGFGLNVDADGSLSWFGPLGTLLLVVGTVAVLYVRKTFGMPRVVVPLALAPWLILLLLVITIVWDPHRGRFLVFGAALAAAAWGVLARSEVARAAVTAIAVVSVGLALANYTGKASGLSEIWTPNERPFVLSSSIWGAERAAVLARLRPGSGEKRLYEYLEDAAPDDARLAVVPRENDFLSPYFAPELSRHVVLVEDDGLVPADADWLIVHPTMSVRGCTRSWETVFRGVSGWRVERRIAPDTCADPDGRTITS
jgi:hypothetical protein